MTALDLLQTIGRAKPGTRMIVIDPITAVNAFKGGEVNLPHGTKIEVLLANGASLSVVAEVGGDLVRAYIFAEHYPSLALEA
jgi:hypothetical protein